jgi:hypothetical protein
VIPIENDSEHADRKLLAHDVLTKIESSVGLEAYNVSQEHAMSDNNPIVVKTDSVTINTAKGRNYSFLHKNQDSLDLVEEGNFVVPAQPGSCYWGILRVAYENHDTPIKVGDFIDMVAAVMEEREPDKWERFKNKKRIKTVKNDSVVEKDANHWRTRIETNIKTMTRHGGSNPYGARLSERGHILRWEPDHFGGQGGYVLRTDTNQPLKKAWSGLYLRVP